MTHRDQSINSTLEIQVAGTVLGARRSLNLSTGLSVSDDTDGVVTVEAEGGGSELQPIRVETDSYGPGADDLGYLLRFQTVDAVNLVTLSAAGLEVGFWFDVVFEGVNRLQIAGLPGQTVLSRDDRSDLNGQYARARVQYIEANTWLLDGDLVVGPA